MAKDESFQDNPLNPKYRSGEDPYHAQLQIYSRSTNKLRVYLDEIVATVARYPDRILIFEDYPDLSDTAGIEKYQHYLELYEINPDVGMPFNFEGIFTDFTASAFERFIDGFQSWLPNQYTPVYCFGNHDQSRLASRFGPEQSRLIALLQLTLPGLPVVYYGDEIGMVDGDVPSDQIRDSFEKQTPGIGLGRDPERTPMQWTDDMAAGFSSARPWLPVPKILGRHTVEDESADTTSQLTLYKTLLALRHRYATFRTGSYETILSSKKLFAFKRQDTEATFLIILNFSEGNVAYCFDQQFEQIISSNLRDVPMDSGKDILLLPYEALIIQL